MSGALKDKDDGVRVLAATSLGEIKARAAIPALREALDDKSAQVAFAAAQALWKMDDRSGRDVFYEILDGERKASPSLLKSKMHEANQDMHSPSALALISINEASGALLGPFSMGVSMIEEAAKNSSAPIQSLCAQMLADDNNKTTVDELEDALSDKNWTIRAAAARALAKLNATRALPDLKDMMLNDKSQPARFAAAAAIVKLDEHPATRKSKAPDSAPSKPELSTRPPTDKST
jgi:HEAT repeat protein